jgi:adenylate cyclase
MERRLAAVMAADVVGYSRLMGANEVGTLTALRSHREDLVDRAIEDYSGRIVKLTGDGVLAEFSSAASAVECAVFIQRAMEARNADVPDDRKIQFRIGVNVGDVIFEDDDIFGDGVNIAARIEKIARPGGVAISGSVRSYIGNELGFVFEDSGEHALKNIHRPVSIFHVMPQRGPGAGTAHTAQPKTEMPSIAVLPFANMSGDPEQEYFADGMTEDIITDLSKISGLFVVGRNSVFVYKGKAVKLQQAAQELGVRYIL